MVDTKIYYVTGPNGFRGPWETLACANTRGRRMREQMKAAGWAGTLRVYYRDGTCANTL